MGTRKECLRYISSVVWELPSAAVHYEVHGLLGRDVPENKHKIYGAVYVVNSDLIRVRLKGHPRKSHSTRLHWPRRHGNATVSTACNSTSLPTLGGKQIDVTPTTVFLRPSMWAGSGQGHSLGLVSSSVLPRSYRTTPEGESHFALCTHMDTIGSALWSLKSSFSG